MISEESPQAESAVPATPVLIAGPVSIATFIRFLFGASDAIECIARAKHGWLLGAIFVLSAGLAREYDRSDLTAEPSHLLLPFVASVVSAIVLYGFVRLFASVKATGKQPGFLEFLQIYWATAPLAWLYALPVERWLGAADAVAANLWLLGIVAVWRVILMVRTVQTLWGADAVSAAAIVCAFGDAVLILALLFSPVPVLDVMSGNRLSPAERVLQETHLLITVLAWLSIPIWLIGLAWAGASSKWPPASRLDHPESPGMTLQAWAAGAGVVIIGGMLCWWEQPRLQNATTIKNLVARQEYQSALDRLSSLTPDDFPAHWELPPYPNYSYTRSEDPRRLVQFFVAAVQAPRVPDWVRTGLQDKVIRGFVSFWLGDQMVQALTNEDLELLVAALEAAHASGVEFPCSRHGIPRLDPEKDARRAELTKRLEVVFECE